MRVQENKEWDGYREAQNWDADVLDTPEDDDVERGVCVCVCVCVCVGQVLSTLQGPNVPKRGIKTKMSVWAPANSSHEENGLIKILK